ncbi:hypothetical protein [Nocardia sp. NPDC047648]|uniref:hypothetical protein n=1 Tax=Nocardia sp. NPDC047648 TaxID=3155625 RepID=UPI0033F7C4E6
MPTEATARCGTLLPRSLVGLPGHRSDALGAHDRIDVDATEPDACLAELCGGVDTPIVGSRGDGFRPISVAGATQSGVAMVLVEPVS